MKIAHFVCFLKKFVLLKLYYLIDFIDLNKDREIYFIKLKQLLVFLGGGFLGKKNSTLLNYTAFTEKTGRNFVSDHVMDYMENEVPWERRGKYLFCTCSK